MADLTDVLKKAKQNTGKTVTPAPAPATPKTMVNPNTGVMMNESQTARYQNQLDQMSGKITPQQAQAARDKATADALSKSTTIDRYVPTDPKQVQAQQEINQRLGIDANVGLRTAPRSEPTVATQSNPIVTKGSASVPQIPGTPVPSDDEMMQTILMKQYKNQPLNDDEVKFQINQEMQKYKNPSMMGGDMGMTTMDKTKTTTTTTQPGMPGMSNQPLPFSVEDYINATPEQKAQMQQTAFNQGAQQQMDMLNKIFEQMGGQSDARIKTAEERLAEEQKALEDENAGKVDEFKKEQDLITAQQVNDLNKAGDSRLQQIKDMQSFSGFGRSTKTIEILDNASADTQRAIEGVERESRRAVNEYQAGLVDKMNNRLDKLRDKVDKAYDEKDAMEMQKTQQQLGLMLDLFKQNPSNPENMIKTAESISKERIEMAKLDAAEKKEVQNQARQNFQFMVTNFGSEYFNNLDDESLSILADNMGMPSSALKNMGKTLAEQKNEWDKLQYFDTQQFQRENMLITDQLAQNRDMQNFNQQLQLNGLNQQFDIAKLQMTWNHENDQDLAKFKQLANAVNPEYAKFAINGDTSSLQFPFPLPHPSGNIPVVSLNSRLAQAFPEGFKFKAADGANGLGGQCVWFAEQLTSLGGKDWRLGNSLAEKTSSVDKYAKQGLAYKLGQQQPQVGQTIITNESATNGHGAVINAITPEGKWVLTEANYAGPLKVTNTRVFDPKKDGAKVIGILKTEPKKEFQITSDLLASASKQNVDLEKFMNNAINAGKIEQNLGQKAQQAFDQGNNAWMMGQQAKTQTSPFLESVKAGKTELSKEQEQMLMQDPTLFNQYMEAKGAAKTGKDAKELPASAVDKLAKYQDVNQMLGDIETQYAKLTSPDPITGQIAMNDPYNADVQQLNRMITATVPSLARGVFGEVGVLTESDVENYKKLLADARTPKDQAKNALDFLKKRLTQSYGNYMQSYGAAGYNTDKFANLGGFGNSAPKPAATTNNSGNKSGYSFQGSGGNQGGSTVSYGTYGLD